MSLLQLSLSSFRNLKDCTLDFDRRINLVHGDNGAGKTALLEAISIITQGKSFRTRRLSQCIQFGKESFLLFGRHDQYRAGLQYGNTKRQIRIDGEHITSTGILASKTALLTIDQSSIELITGKPHKRRQFIDWLLFHVKQGYADLWNRTDRLLKQRNALLKSRKNPEMLDLWDPELVEYSVRLNDLRRDVLQDLIAEFSDHEIRYFPGFDEDYAEQLSRNRPLDIRSGFTRHHFNRADLQFFDKEGNPASEVLSRGQTKQFAINLLIQGLWLIQNATNKPLIVLIDDMAAELDAQNLSTLYEAVRSLDAQVFATGISLDRFPPRLLDQCRMFHVEHGMIGVTKA